LDVVEKNEFLSLTGCDVGLKVVDDLGEAFDIVAWAFQLIQRVF